MFFEDGSDFVVIVSEADRFEAKERDLDTRFGHVAVVTTEKPAADEGFDCGLSAVFGEDRVGGREACEGARQANEPKSRTRTRLRSEASARQARRRTRTRRSVTGLARDPRDVSRKPHGGPQHRLRGFGRAWDGRR